MIGQPPVNSPMVVQGCLTNNDWCEVKLNGRDGWMRASDLGVTTGNGMVLLSQQKSEAQVSTLNCRQKKVNRRATGGAVAGAVVRRALVGPVGAAICAVVGPVGGAAMTVPQ